MPEKQDMSQRDEGDLFDERVAQRADRMIDQNAAIVKGNDLHVRRQAGLDRGDLLFHGRDHLARVGAVANDDHTANRLFAILVENAAPEFGPQLHAAYIAQSDRGAVGGTERNVLDVLESANEADAAHDLLAVADFDHLGAHVVVTALDGADHLLERYVVRAKLDGVEI